MTLQPGSRPVPNCPDYILVRKLGAGAFGEVWHANGPGGFDVALKFIRLSQQGLALELRSLEAVKSIRHPNLVSLFGAWLDDSWLILSMELCDCSLQDVLAAALDRGLPGVPLPSLMKWVTDAANGLDALNAKQVQHRDVKPANLLLLDSGLKVADFGVAKVLEQTVGSNTGAGTIAYTAPECFKGKLAQQSDQYSLAVTYYHLRTGRPLFQGDQAQMMYGHLELQPDLSALPASEQAILARALAKEPGMRWPSCRDFARALSAASKQAVETERRRQEEHSHCFDGLFAEEERRQEGERQRQETDRRRPAENHQKRIAAVAQVSPARVASAAPDRTARTDSQTLRPPGSLHPVGVAIGVGMLWFLPAAVIATMMLTSQSKSSPEGHMVTSVALPEPQPGQPVADGQGHQANTVAPRHAKPIHSLATDDSGENANERLRTLAQEAPARQLPPRGARYYGRRGNDWFVKREYGKAIGDYTEAIRLDPPSAANYNNRANAWYMEKEYDKAIADYTEAIRLETRNAAATLTYVNRGYPWAMKQEYGKAIEDYAEAIKLDPTCEAAYNALAWLLVTCRDEKFRDRKSAIQAATRACNLTSWKNGWTLSMLAVAYEADGQLGEAERCRKMASDDASFRGPAGDYFRQRYLTGRVRQ